MINREYIGLFLCATLTMSSGKALAEDVISTDNGSKEKSVFFFAKAGRSSGLKLSTDKHRLTGQIEGDAIPKFNVGLKLEPMSDRYQTFGVGYRYKETGISVEVSRNSPGFGENLYSGVDSKQIRLHIQPAQDGWVTIWSALAAHHLQTSTTDEYKTPELYNIGGTDYDYLILDPLPGTETINMTRLSATIGAKARHGNVGFSTGLVLAEIWGERQIMINETMNIGRTPVGGGTVTNLSQKVNFQINSQLFNESLASVFVGATLYFGDTAELRMKYEYGFESRAEVALVANLVD